MMRLFLLSVAVLVVSGPGNVHTQGTNTTTTTTTAAPTPAQPAYRNNWTVYDADTQMACILFEANVTVAVKYLKKNSTSRSSFVDVVVPEDAFVDTDNSDCHFDSNTQLLRVNFSQNKGGKYWALSFYFTNDTKRNGGKAFGLSQIMLHALYDRFNDTEFDSEDFVSSNTTTYGEIVGASADHSSQCSASDLVVDDNAKVHMDTFRIQAFSKNGSFSAPEQCTKDSKTSDIVPIVVGACLAALVIIVLVAYLIGRARAKRQGYASV